MAHYLCRLNPPRPTFAQDMSPDEAQLMAEHGAYWTAHMSEGRVLVFGVVGDPDGAWGVSILAAADEAAARSLTARDPVILADRGFSYDVFAMPNAVTPEMIAGSND